MPDNSGQGGDRGRKRVHRHVEVPATRRLPSQPPGDGKPQIWTRRLDRQGLPPAVKGRGQRVLVILDQIAGEQRVPQDEQVTGAFRVIRPPAARASLPAWMAAVITSGLRSR